MPIDFTDIQKDLLALANHLINPEFYNVSFKQSPDADAFVLGLYDKKHNFFVETLIPTIEILDILHTTELLKFIEHKIMRLKLTLLKYPLALPNTLY